jgi:uncharacterized damage-inducible protein DinB
MTTTATTTTTNTTTNPTTDPADPAIPAILSGERADLLESLRKHRFFLRLTVRGLTDEQARLRPTASELCLGGIVKHVTQVERNWVRFIEQGPDAVPDHTSDDVYAEWLDGHTMRDDETLAGILEGYEAMARHTDELLATVDLDASHPLPPAPWFEPGARWTARRVLLHIMAETAQHAGHADIIRETIDGQKSMG